MPAAKTEEPGAGRNPNRTPSGLSVCIITRNEELRLPRCLGALGFADEVIVVDSGSDDATQKIARKSGARVFHRDFDGYIAQKNHAISFATHRWILIVDADEVVPEDLAKEIREIVDRSGSQAPAYRVYRVPRLTWYLGRWIRHSGWYPDYNIRFFEAGAARMQGGAVHETGATDHPIGTLRHPLEHYSYAGISDHLQRIDHYTTLVARDRFERGKRAGLIGALFRGIWKFFVAYVLRGGFLDGRAGLVLAVLGGYYNFLKYAKLWELRRGFVNYRDSRTRAPRQS